MKRTVTAAFAERKETHEKALENTIKYNDWAMSFLVVSCTQDAWPSAADIRRP
jgi:hypothetical protein